MDTDQVQHLRVTRDQRGVVTLTFDRPEVRNAFNPELMHQITETISRLANEGEDVRAVVLTGAGTTFSAGADLAWMSAIVANSFEENVEDSRRFERLLRTVHDAPMPVLARVNGHALGGAAGLLGCVDIAVAVEGAKLGFTEVRLGIAPAMISAYVLPRIGVSNARRYLLTGERFDAQRALAIGLVHEVCSPEELDATFDAIVEEVLAAAPNAQRATKQLIQRVAASDTPADSEEDRVELISRLRASTEAQHRIGRFLDGAG